MPLLILGFAKSEFIPWPDDHRDPRFTTRAGQGGAAESQPDVLTAADQTAVEGVALIEPSQVLLPEAWNQAGASGALWTRVEEDPRVTHIHGAVQVPEVVLRERLPGALAAINRHYEEDRRLRAAQGLERIVEVAAALHERGDALLLIISP